MNHRANAQSRHVNVFLGVVAGLVSALWMASCGNAPVNNGGYYWDPDAAIDAFVPGGDVTVADVAKLDAPTADALSDAAGADAASTDTPSEDATLPDSADAPADASNDAASDAKADASSDAKQCTGAADCDDADPCTTDACTLGKCVHATKQGCIKQPPPCDTKNPCKVGVCDATLRACVECSANKDCGSGKLCVDKTCVAVTACKSDLECKAGGQVCNKQVSACVDCILPGDCGAGMACIESKCYPAAPCDSSKDCAGVCDTNVGLCVDCLSNDDCAAGQYCSANKVCKSAICTANACGSADSFFVCKPGGAGYQTGVACSDSNPCTNNTCSAEKGCSTKFNTLACDDDNACTDADVCSAGTCAGKPTTCDDNNPCTIDSCDQQIGCVSTPTSGACDDGDFCTTGDTCFANSCQGVPKSCNDNNLCTEDSCDPKFGCLNEPVAAPCNDGNKCTSNDVCTNGVCFGSETDCNDNNPCTGDSCNPTIGCNHVNITAACDDGNACTTGDSCNFGVCTPGSPKSCNDLNPCTNDTCANGACQYSNNTAVCSDNDPCTLGDTCKDGACSPGSGQQTCNDGNLCTDDACKAMVGCQYTPNTAPCNDNNACTSGDICAGAKCTGPTPVVCDDQDGCTKDSCDAVKGCGAVPDATKCDDKNICTTDSCNAPSGVCSNVKTPNCCTKQAECDDGDACTTDLCAGNQCLHTANGTCCEADTDCNDGSLCTADACVLGKCQTTKLPSPPAALEHDWENLGDMEGWTPGPPSISSLFWSQTSSKGAQAGTGALIFGNGGAGLNNVQVVNNVDVTSPAVKLPLNGANTLTFAWKQDFTGLNDANYPPLQVDILAAGKTWTAWKGSYNALKVFQLATVDLSALAGQTVQVRLRGWIYGSAATPATGLGVLVDALKLQWTCAPKTCVADADCPSVGTGDCQTGQCVAGACSYTFKCCASGADCNDGNPCTTDSCVAATTKCAYSKVAACCVKNADCSDGNTCTLDTCGANNKCAYSGIAECCTSNAQCNDGDACTIDSCNAGTCTFKNTCCKADADCNDKDDVCTIDTCVAGKCTYASTGKPGCCLPILWQEAFDGAGPLGTWKITNSGGATKGWQVWSPAAAGITAKSAPSVLYYGDPVAQNFNFGANNGTATTGTITIPVATKPSLKFWLYLNTEGGSTYDKLDISIVKGGVSSQIWSKGSANPQMGAWQEIAVDLAAYSGQQVQFVLTFNTVDSVANSGIGVLIDDLRVSNTCP